MTYKEFCQQVKDVFGKDCKMTYREINGEVKRTKDDWIEEQEGERPGRIHDG